jgi:hypothetical protein
VVECAEVLKYVPVWYFKLSRNLRNRVVVAHSATSCIKPLWHACGVPTRLSEHSSGLRFKLKTASRTPWTEESRPLHVHIFRRLVTLLTGRPDLVLEYWQLYMVHSKEKSVRR